MTTTPPDPAEFGLRNIGGRMAADFNARPVSPQERTEALEQAIRGRVEAARLERFTAAVRPSTTDPYCYACELRHPAPSHHA